MRPHSEPAPATCSANRAAAGGSSACSGRERTGSETDGGQAIRGQVVRYETSSRETIAVEPRERRLLVPEGRSIWRVVAYTYKGQTKAEDMVSQINEKHSNLGAEVFTPKKRRLPGHRWRPHGSRPGDKDAGQSAARRSARRQLRAEFLQVGRLRNGVSVTEVVRWMGRVPHVRLSVRGPKMTVSNAFPVLAAVSSSMQESVRGAAPYRFRPTYAAGERGAPVLIPEYCYAPREEKLASFAKRLFCL